MSMLTLNGQVMNVFNTPASTDKKTGEVRPAADRVQIHAENTLENGEKRFELVTLKVSNGDAFRKIVGKQVRIAVGAFVSGKSIVFYALKDQPHLVG